jgi:hypothetical protein
MDEFRRQGVIKEDGSSSLFKQILLGDDVRVKWKIDWPTQVYIPLGLNQDEHLKCGYSRNNCRFPILSYFNKKYGFSLWRSSSLALDSTSRRSKDDEVFLKALN